MIKLKGLKKAVGEYKKYNVGGYYSPQYAELMLDTETGEIWTDYFYSLGHNEYKIYHSPTIINIGRMMREANIEISMANVKDFVASR